MHVCCRARAVITFPANGSQRGRLPCHDQPETDHCRPAPASDASTSEDSSYDNNRRASGPKPAPIHALLSHVARQARRRPIGANNSMTSNTAPEPRHTTNCLTTGSCELRHLTAAYMIDVHTAIYYSRTSLSFHRWRDINQSAACKRPRDKNVTKLHVLSLVSGLGFRL